ncbi:MAG: hypothetical protein IAE89_13780 [Anaerolineae bacterium]|nr:hypothetical protein [Anaerolineae bacterium]
MTLDTTAGPSFLGYLYQIEYALYLLLKADRDEAEIAVEYMDDVQFSDSGTAVEMFQLKHSIRAQATLTDASPALWKTLRTWSAHLQAGNLPIGSVLTLVTTAIASPNTIAQALKPTAGRDNKGISEQLLEIAANSNNTSLQPAFDVYKGLSSQQRETLVGCIRLIDGEPNVEQITDRIKPLLQVRYQHKNAFYDRLHGWWFERVKRHVVDHSSRTITKRELNDQIADLNDQFRSDSLPIDFSNSRPSEEPDAVNDQRIFVHQLRQIMLNNREIEFAIVDYYRAFEQRSRWEREQLLHLNELTQYEQRLMEEWERVSERVKRQKPYLLTDGTGLQSLGREVFDLCQDLDLRIRDAVTEPYVRRGSFHMLANEDVPRVFWHPQFIARLQELLPNPEALSVDQPPEIANLFNAAFTTRILRTTIKSYEEEAQRGMPFSLTFLVLPIVLYKPVRDLLPRDTRTKMHVWIREHQEAKIQFPSRTRSLVPITRESLMFGMHHAVIQLGDDADLVATKKPFRKRNETVFETEEVKHIENRAQFLGKWFAKAGSVSSIYMMWSIRP